MKHTTKALAALFAIQLLVSCNGASKHNQNATDKPVDKIEKVKWLIGEWQNKSSEGFAVEMWEKQNDSTLVGKSFFIIGNDTVSSERLSLEQHGDSCFYIPTVQGQNNNQPVRFLLTAATDKQLIFENPTHDFPQKITYKQINADSLVAEISGTVNGKYQAQQFPLHKTN